MPRLARSHSLAFRWCVGVLCAVALLWAGLIILRAIFPLSYRAEILQYSAANHLDPALVASLIRNESRFRSDVVSTAGAIGLMQIMPESGAWIAGQLSISSYSPDQLEDPTFNILLGTWYVRYLLDRYGSLETALWAYNAGPSRADVWLAEGDLPYLETQAYADRVRRHLAVYRIALQLSWLYAVVPALPI
jgi:soluble lytic murein transglycosylase